MSDSLIFLARPAAEARKGPAGPGDPFAAFRVILFQDDQGFAAGHVDCAGPVTVCALPHAEMLVVVAGGLDVAGMALAAGQACVLPRGFSGRVTPAAGTRWSFCTMNRGETADAPAPIRLEPTLTRNPSPGPAAEVVIGTPPECHSLNLFTDSSGMRAGVWDVTTPCARSFVPHRVHELMHLIEGEVILSKQGGAAQSVMAGESIFLPRGAPYAWTSQRPVVKYYCVL